MSRLPKSAQTSDKDRQESSDLSRVHKLLYEVRSLGKRLEVDRLSSARAVLDNLVRIENRAAEASSDGSNWNLICLAGVSRREAGFHSPLLADLLNPYGSHGQGSIFLAGFLRLVSTRCKEFGEFDAPLAKHPSRYEWWIACEREKIDIIVLSVVHKVLIFIENKIDAVEQKDQLARYRQRLARHCEFEHRALIYLTPRSAGAPRSGQPHLHLHYETDVAGWLLKSFQDIKSSRLREGINQYLDVVSDLSGGELDAW